MASIWVSPLLFQKKRAGALPKQAPNLSNLSKTALTTCERGLFWALVGALGAYVRPMTEI